SPPYSLSYTTLFRSANTIAAVAAAVFSFVQAISFMVPFTRVEVEVARMALLPIAVAATDVASPAGAAWAALTASAAIRSPELVRSEEHTSELQSPDH